MINLPVVAVVVGGVGFCIWRFFRKRRVTKEQVGWGCNDYDHDHDDDDDYDDDDDGDWQWLVVYDQVKKAQDEQGLVEGEEEPDFLEEEPLKVFNADNDDGDDDNDDSGGGHKQTMGRPKNSFSFDFIQGRGGLVESQISPTGFFWDFSLFRQESDSWIGDLVEIWHSGFGQWLHVMYDLPEARMPDFNPP